MKQNIALRTATLDLLIETSLHKKYDKPAARNSLPHKCAIWVGIVVLFHIIQPANKLNLLIVACYALLILYVPIQARYMSS